MRIGRGGETVASVAKRWRLSPGEVAQWNHVSPSGKFAAGSTAVLFLPRSTSLARATPHAASARVAAAPARGKARVAQSGNARSGTHVVTSKATRKPKAAVVARKSGGTPTKANAKTRVAQP
jgi:membrane-bound lytic murein transglycosylase D